MPQFVEMQPKICVVCEIEFQPKPGGWNARYCSDHCRIMRRPRQSRSGEETYYSKVTKQDPEKLAEHHRRAGEQRQKTRQWLADYKVGLGCVDCGFNSHPAALQLDHTGDKTADISLIRSSIKRMLAEIEAGKCVVRCANCHSIKTWAERNGIPNPSGHSVYVRSE